MKILTSLSKILLAACLLTTLACVDSDDINVSFDIELLTVNVITTGTNPDPDGYTLSVTSQPDESIGINDTRIFSVLRIDITVELSDVAANCTVNANPQTLDVNGPATVTFVVECV
jgi:hypothetical protein